MFFPVSFKPFGAFVNEQIVTILQRTDEFGLYAIQLHGKETPEFCKELLDAFHAAGKETTLIKAFSIATAEDLERTAPYSAYCHYFLFDTPCTGYGGSGKTFNWQVLSEYHGKTPFLLSGGISPEQIGALNEFTHPQWAGIDLNSHFEIRPAYKDALLIKKFIQEIKK